MASLYLRGGTYWIQYYRNGRRIQKSLKTSDLSAAKFLKNKIENDVSRGQSPLPDSSKSAFEVLKEFLLHCENRLTPGAYRNIKTCNESFIAFAKPGRISDITLTSVNEYLRKRASGENAVGDVMRNHDIKHIKQFIKYAVDQNYLSENPLKNLRKIKENKEPPRYLSKEEIRMILDAAQNTRFYVPILTGLYTGMRYGELMNLTWADVDLDVRQIVVRKAKSRQFRAIPIHDNLLSVLRPLAGPAQEKCFSKVNQQKTFRAICRKTKLTGIGWHTLRHTFASHMVMAGVDILTVAKLLGHSNVETTQIYAHLSRDHVAESIKRLTF